MDNNKKEAGECTEENGNSSVDREESSIRSISVSGNKNFVVNNCNFNYINIPENKELTPSPSLGQTGSSKAGTAVKQPEKRAPVRKEEEVPSKKKKGASTSQDSAIERKKPCLHDESVDEKDHQSTSQDSAVERKKPCLHDKSVDKKDHQGHEEKVTEEELRDIAPQIANDRMTVAAKLGLKAFEIANIEANYYGAGKGGIEETALQMLLKWQRSNGKEATTRTLVKALKKSGLKTVAEELEGRLR